MGVLCLILEIPGQKQIVLNSLLLLINADDVVCGGATARAALVGTTSARGTARPWTRLVGSRVGAQIIDLLLYFLNQPNKVKKYQKPLIGPRN